MYAISLENKNSFLRKVFLQMFFGIVLTVIVSVGAIFFPSVLHFTFQYFKFIVFGQLGLVLFLNFKFPTLSSGQTKLMFYVYSITTGITIVPIYFRYTFWSIVMIFLGTALIFVLMAIYGMRTKEDLSKYSTFFKIGLISLIITSVANFFIQSSLMTWGITVFGVVLFTALIAYDVNRICAMFDADYLDEEQIEKYSAMGALILYLDFINLFLKILKLLGKKRR